MASKSPNQRYTLYETADANGVKRRFLYQYQGEVLEVRRVFDHSVGCGAFILDRNVPSGIRRHLEIINSSDFDRDHVLGMPDPIWEHMLEDELDIPLLHKVSTHVWRATLNTEWMQKGVPEVVRSAYFGHSPGVNRSYYTDTTNVSVLVDMLRRDGDKSV